MRVRRLTAWVVLTCLVSVSGAAEPQAKKTSDTSRGDAMIAAYFRAETAKLTANTLADIETKEDWMTHRAEYHRQLREMLGLDPWPERTPLEAVVTGTVEHDEFTVENLHFQSMPGLYVTANLYLPKDRKPDQKLPAILYVCGHGRVAKNGISYGNKTHYQHHGGWFARNGYACLTIDTIQLGEIEGLHHGTYREGMWWWHSRGYTPAGVEAWNGIRALDYLQSRPEVDGQRLGITGRSGGGAYSWWVAALDERIKVAVPVAGITSLHNHVVDGCVEGHCDCMYQVNTYRWDYPLVAALIAPRPLLISNTDKDRIFPLDGVVDVYFKTRRIYKLLGEEDKVGLQITEGPHHDTQELHIHAFHWFNEYLKGQNPPPPIEMAAVKFFDPEQLKVFPPKELPADERVTSIHEDFVPQQHPEVPKDREQWDELAESLQQQLREKSFRGWPQEEYQDDASLELTPMFSATHGDAELSGYEFTSQHSIRLPLYVLHQKGVKPEDLKVVALQVLDDAGWKEFLSMARAGFAEHFTAEMEAAPDVKALAGKEAWFRGLTSGWGVAFVPPRGVGPTAWNQTERKQTQIRRRFALLGQTLDGMQVWDTVRAAQALRAVDGMKDVPLWLSGEDKAAGTALYAALFVPDVKRIDLHDLAASHRDGPDFLNVLKFMDVPQAVALASRRMSVFLYTDKAAAWSWPNDIAKEFAQKPHALEIRPLP